MLLHFDDERGLAERVARLAGLTPATIARHRFPDGEVKLTLPPRLPRRVVLLRSLDDPDHKLVELLLASAGARELGARHVTLVAPYLAYMRQDTAFAPGESVSQRHVGAFLAERFERVITVDPHLHRVSDLADVLPGCRAVTLSAAPVVGAFLARQARGAVLIGPDEESAQWVRAVAGRAGAEWAVCGKERRGDRSVRIRLPNLDVDGRRVVLVDDMASTGRTLARTARALLRAGAQRIDVAVTHALFSGDAVKALREAGVRGIWSTDSVRHPSNRMPLAPLLAPALAR